ncbi:MAG TPA: saccharopine dehydrogenase NADP-binding domain-containing protein [Myxococcales bacterium]|nr:saccharopine dehydrogenase NADP-binding domain-containing protein [Myxococcales bacterium]
MPRWLLYGAYGYTGRLIAEHAVARGQRPVLAGRSADKLAALAGKLGLEHVAVSLDDPAALRRALEGASAVLHAAGPFVHTSAPMRRACLDAGASYLDITGEIPVFEAAFAEDGEARSRGVALICGVGFDVVPTDCLAVHVARQLASPFGLELAIDAGGNASAGTMKSALGLLPKGGVVRRGGKLVPWRLGRGARDIRFSHGVRHAVPIPWGDLATAFRSTGCPDITTYMAVPPGQAKALAAFGSVLQLALGVPSLQRAALSWAERRFPGPDEQERREGHSRVWARTVDREGNEAQGWLELGDGYAFTAASAVRAVERTLEKKPVGALTPAQAFGADFVLEMDGVRRLDAL